MSKRTIIILPMLALFGLLTWTPRASAQTGTFTANGYGTCQNSAPIQQALYCTVTLSQNGVFQGYFTFYAVNNYTPTISSGEVWRFDSSDQQTGYGADVTGTIDTANYIVTLQFSNTLTGNAMLGYKIRPRYCSRYCYPARVVITSGIVTLN